MIELSEEQIQCKEAVHRWDEARDKPTFLINGYAGTGKTSTTRQTVDELEGLTLYAAYTGKAALVMQSRGCVGASTLHKLIYTPGGSAGKEQYKEKEAKYLELRKAFKAEGMQEPEIMKQPQVKKLWDDLEMLTKEAHSPIFRLNPDSPLRDAARLVIDECSMLGSNITKDILSFKIPIIVQGDPGQLPPVADEGYFDKLPPDFTLTQIHRQAKDSPIIKLATQARQKEPLRPGTYGDSKVITKSQMTPGMAMEADQILCGRNSTRHLNNARMRQLKGFGGPIPQPGEKLVCLRNNHEAGLLNGSLWIVDRCNQFGRRKLSLTVHPEEGGPSITVLAHSAYFTQYGNAFTADGQEETKGPNGQRTQKWVVELTKEEKALAFEMREAECFTYGYVLTVHKAQGSQWDNVLVLDESGSFGEHAHRHLYTAVTRAAKTVVIRL